MGEFAKQVRTNKIPGPLRRAFTPAEWQKAFSDIQAPDTTDRDIFDAGLAIHEKLQAIRDRLKLSSSPEISATTKIRAFAAVANYNYFVTRDKTQRAMERAARELEAKPGPFYSFEALMSVKLSLYGGFKWSPAEVMESLVDGMEIPVRIVLQSSPSLAGNPRMNQIDWEDAALELNLGIVYRFAADVWDDCLWNDYKVFDRGSKKDFIPQDTDALLGYRIGIARRLSLISSFNMIATQFQRQVSALGMRPRIREVCGLERHGKRQVLKVSKSGPSTKMLQEISALRMHATEPYYDELLEEPLESLDGLTLSEIIDAWSVVSRAAIVLIDLVDAKYADCDHPRTLSPEYAPVLQRDALVDALSAAAGIRKHAGNRIVEFFTFRGKPGQEVWAQPLIPVGPNTVVPAFAAVVSPNLRRLVDVWMRQVGVDLAKRGPAFEAHIRSITSEAIKASKILSSHAMCVDHDYTFRPQSGRDEQIDLLFSIGNSIFVGEAKCILEPTEAKSIAMHHKTIVDAAEQVLRKATSLREHRTEFIADAKTFGITLDEAYKVIPLVVVSTSTHVGVPALKVPVIDELILGRFLDGWLEDVAVQTSDLSVVERSRAVFYSNAIEAEDRAPSYFESPPQLRRFHDGVRGRVVPLMAIHDRDWSGRVVTLECVPEGIPISQLTSKQAEDRALP